MILNTDRCYLHHVQATNLNNNQYWSNADYSAFQATYGALQLAWTATWPVSSASWGN